MECRTRLGTTTALVVDPTVEAGRRFAQVRLPVACQCVQVRLHLHLLPPTSPDSELLEVKEGAVGGLESILRGADTRDRLATIIGPSAATAFLK